MLSRWLVAEMRRSHGKLFRTITDKRMPSQTGFLLLRMCAVPLVQYWIRTSPPTASAELAEAFDDEIMQAARAIMNLPVLSDLAQKQIVLAATAGGFGLRSMKMITTSSWVASMAQAIQYMSTLVDHKSLSQTLSTEIDGALFTLAQVPSMHALPTDSSEFWQYFTVEPAGAGFQKTLSAAILSEARKSLLTLVEDIQSEKARLIAVAAESAGAWLTMAPTHHLLTMKDEHFNHAARLRLGIRPFDDTRTCQCGGQLALDLPLHVLCIAAQNHDTQA